MGSDPGRHQPMQIIPFMHIKSPEAIITKRGGVTVPRATRCTRRVAPGQPSPAVPSRARQRPLGRGNPAPHGARVSRRGGSGTLPRWLGPGSGTAPSSLPPRHRPVGHHRRWRRHPPPVAASPGAADSPAVAPGTYGAPYYYRQGAWKRAWRCGESVGGASVHVGGRLRPACTGMREEVDSGGHASVLQFPVVAEEKRQQRLRRRLWRRRRWRRRRW